MSDSVRIRMKFGSREIEIEGSHEHVDDLLRKWWLLGKASEVEGDDGAVNGPSPMPTKRKAKRQSKRTLLDQRQSGVSEFDPQPLINSMREDPSYQRLEEKVLHEKNMINKIKLVALHASKPLTTGEMKKVLEGLGVKVSLPRLSEAIKAGISDFIQDSARTKGAIVRYNLTSKAEKDFKLWLQGNE